MLPQKKHMIRNTPTCCWFCHCSFSISEFLTELPNSGTNRPVLGPKKNCYGCHGHRAPLIWRSHPWSGSAGLLGHIPPEDGYRLPPIYMVLGRDSLLGLSLHNQCHHCPEKIDKTWHNTSFVAEQILERRDFWAKPIASLPKKGFSGKPEGISPTDARKLMRSSGTRSYCSTFFASLL